MENKSLITKNSTESIFILSDRLGTLPKIGTQLFRLDGSKLYAVKADQQVKKTLLGSSMFFCLPEPHPDPLITSSNPNPKKNKKNLVPNFCNFFISFTRIPDPHPDVCGHPEPHQDPFIRGTDPDPHQNVMDPQH